MKMEIQQFACPIAPYQGVENLGDREFNAQLQFFACRISLLASLHTGGKLPTDETYRGIATLLFFDCQWRSPCVFSSPY